MTWRNLRRSISGLVLFTIVLAGPWLNHDRVICVQKNSHVRVERAGADCCRQEIIEAPSGSFSVGSSDDDCGSCVDKQIALNAAQLAQRVTAASNPNRAINSSVGGHLPLSVGIGAQASREEIPLYPLPDNLFSFPRLFTVIRC